MICSAGTCKNTYIAESFVHRGECVLSVFLYFSSITHLNGKLFISCML